MESLYIKWISVEFSKVPNLVEFSRFPKYRVDIGRIFRLVDFSRIFRLWFRVKEVSYRVFLLIAGGGI